MPRFPKVLVGVLVVLLCIAAPVAFALHMQSETRNFRVVKEGVLYRSGQTTSYGLKNLLHEYRIRTVVSLRDSKTPGEPPSDQAEEDYCKTEEINYVRLAPACFYPTDDGPAPVQANVDQFLAVMRDPANYPVLVHCFAGTHRTGAYCAVYHMEFDRWDNDRAIDEMRAYGYYNIQEEKDILGYLKGYKPAWRDAADARGGAR